MTKPPAGSSMKFRQGLYIAVIGVLLVILWILVDSALAVVIGIMLLGALFFTNSRSKPRWINAVWSWCKDASPYKNGPWSW